MSNIVSMVPKVRTTEASSQPAAIEGLQPQANVTSSDLARLSLQASDNNAPITSQALRDVAVQKFVTNNGLEYRGDIYEMMEQEADRMVGRGLFRSRDEAENAIRDAYEVFVQKADPQEVAKAIDDLSDPERIQAATEARVKSLHAEYETLAAELESAEQALSPLRMAWLGCHVKLKPFGLDGTAPEWEKRAENLLKQIPDPHKRRRLRPLLQEELAARLAYNAASQKCDTLRKQIADNLRHPPQLIRALVTEELETFEEFLCSCRDPGKRKMKGYVQFRLAKVQKESSEDIADSMRVLKAQARAAERFVDLGVHEQAKAWLENETSELALLTQAWDEIARTSDITLEGIEAIHSEYERILAEVLKSVPGMEHMIWLMAKNEETFHYEGPCEQEVAVLISLFKLRTYAMRKLSNLQNEETELSDQIRKKRVFLGLERPAEFESFTNMDDTVAAFLALRGEEKRRMSHFLWLVAGSTDPVLFDPNSYIQSATELQLRYMIQLSLASRKIDRFYASVKHLEESNSPDKQALIKKAWDNLVDPDESSSGPGVLARSLLAQAVWGLRGLINPKGECSNEPSQNYYGDTIGQCDAPVFEALRRLSKNKLMLFKKQNERDAIESFVGKLVKTDDSRTEWITIEKMTHALAILQAASPEAYELLQFAIGNARAQGRINGPDYLWSARISADYLAHCGSIAIELWRLGRYIVPPPDLHTSNPQEERKGDFKFRD